MFYTLQMDYFATNSSQQSFTKNIAKIKTIRDFTNPTPFLVKYRAPIKLPAIPKKNRRNKSTTTRTKLTGIPSNSPIFCKIYAKIAIVS